MFSWLNDTSLPRCSGGAISAMYMGAISSAPPTPKPPTTRAMTSRSALGAHALPAAETVKRAAVSMRIGRRP